MFSTFPLSLAMRCDLGKPLRQPQNANRISLLHGDQDEDKLMNLKLLLSILCPGPMDSGENNKILPFPVIHLPLVLVSR
jgi:hypothetical protein